MIQSSLPPEDSGGISEDSGEVIRIRGARVNNLKNVDLDIPRGKLVVMTGVSGSGKSSLAFETLYAEGQRQYIESLSVYARQYIRQMERPDVDLIDGLQPTVCIDQRPGARNPRSTVATVTEIYDYLRLLISRLGDAYCYRCGEPIRQQSPEEINDRLMRMPEGTKAMIMAPLVRGRRGQHRELLEQIRKAGLVRARIDGEVFDIEHFPELDARKTHDIEAIVDRVMIRESVRDRVEESVRLALKFGEGRMVVCYLDVNDTTDDRPQGCWKDALFSSLHACPKCELSFEELEPRTFSFNSPYGACRECDGLGVREQFDPEAVIGDMELSIDGGALAPYQNLSGTADKRLREELEPFFQSHRSLDWSTPLKDYKPAQFEKLLHGGGKFPGLLLVME
ncbi:MAG: excinuclease ABC subunit A, partial [Planctomycetales bacterium]|nr:excinuclease ABC subunit A [Planctomycetales bacterium]